MKNISVSTFQNYTSTNSNGKINVWKWLLDINLGYKDIVDKIRTSANDKEKKQLKAMLPAITPSGIFSKRKAEHIEEYTGIICIDIDGKDNPQVTDIERLKLNLITNPHIMYCGLSVSGNGLFCLFPLAYPKKHKYHFNAIEQDFKDQGIIIDSSCSDISRLRGYSYDKKPYLNLKALAYKLLIEENSNIPIVSHKLIPSDIDLKNMLLKPIDLNIKVLAPSFNTYNAESRIKNLINRINNQKIDITSKYHEWFAICNIILNVFGDEEGTKYFHEISQYYPNYNYRESQNLLIQCLYSKYNYGIDRIFEIAVKYGID